ncbi:MAG: CAP domain-containing protein [Actinomycetota bacterium]
MGRPRLLATVLVASASAALAGAPGAQAASPGRSPAEATLLAAMNEARVAHGRPPLRLSALLSRPARRHSASLAAAQELSHEGPHGEPFWTRLVAAGYPRNRWMGENLALVSGCGDAARTMVRMWLDSPGHRANLLSRRFRVVGVGVASDDGCAVTVATTDFGG